MGRPRKPTADLKRSGTYRSGRHGARSNVAPRGKPRRPAWLRGDGKGLWEKILRAAPEGTLTAADGPVLAAACRWWAIWREFDSRLGLPAADEYRNTILATTAWKQCDKCLGKLGLSPTERSKISAIDPEQQPDDNDKNRFFKIA